MAEETTAPVPSTPETPETPTEVQAVVDNLPEDAEVEQTGPKKYTVKIDGEELEVTEEELLKGYQTSKAAQKRFHEGAQMRQQALELIELAKKDPRKLLTHPDINVDVKAFAEQLLTEYMEEQMLSPEEKELRATKKKLQEYEDAKRKQEEELEQQRVAELTKKYEEDIYKQIVGVLETTNVPKTNQTVRRAAYYMWVANNQGYTLSNEQLGQLVRDDYINDIKSLFGAANEETLISLLGDDITNKAVKAHLAKVKKAQPQPKKQEIQPSTQPKKEGKPSKMSPDEWKKKNEERIAMLEQTWKK